MQYVIATKRGRITRLPQNAVQKYVQVRGDGKFNFVTDPNQATVFADFPHALQAYGIRCQRLTGGPTWAKTPTADLTFIPVERPQGIRLGEPLNGHVYGG